jgi:hypothetical protein
MINSLQSPFLKFHSQFSSVAKKLPENGKVTEIVKRVAIVAVAPFAYIALGFLYLAGKTYDFFWGKKTVSAVTASEIKEETVEKKLDEVAKKILEIKSSTEVNQSAKFFISLKAGNIEKQRVFIVKNSKINEKNPKLDDLLKDTIKSMGQCHNNVLIDMKCVVYIRHNNSSFSRLNAHAASINASTGASSGKGFLIRLDPRSWIKEDLNTTLKEFAQPIEPQVNPKAEFIVGSTPVYEPL